MRWLTSPIGTYSLSVRCPSQLLERHIGATMPPTIQRDETSVLARCQEVIGYQFQDLTFLQEALTHASGANHRLFSNERLEFLGDAILGAIVCELLFRKFPEYLEGDLTRIKSIVVSSAHLCKISEELGFDEFLVIGKGMGSQDQTPSSVLADVFESSDRRDLSRRGDRGGQAVHRAASSSPRSTRRSTASGG